MIRAIVREAWAESPWRVIGAVCAAPLVVALGYVALVVVLVMGEGMR